MRIPKLRLVQRRIGVVGLYRSGKTVFLTSLINHLQNHSPDRFRLGDGSARVTFDRELPPRSFDPFAYLQHRNQLVERHAWPVKTRTTAEYRCRFYRSDWLISRGEWTLVDFAGERMADILMADCSYAQWSDLLLAIFREHSEYRSLAGPYLAAMDDPATTGEQLLAAYRRLLLELFLNYRPVVSPSTFLLSEDGTWLGDVPRERWADRPAGLDERRQFAPLSPAARAGRGELARQFERHYGDYRSRLAQPLAGWMRHCDHLVVLVDVTTLLAGGEAMYQGNRELLRCLMDRLCPGKSLLGLSVDLLTTLLAPIHQQITRVLDLTWRQISKIAFVATKADKVHQDDRQKLVSLLREMVEPLVAAHRERAVALEVEYFACAAVNSTRSLDGGKLLGAAAGQSEPSVFTPSAVPEQWPPSWQHGQYTFLNVAPHVPARRDAAPDHLGLNQVVDFLMR